MTDKIWIYRYRLPLVRPVQIGDHFMTEREGILLKTLVEDGRHYWRELSPLPGLSEESLDDVLEFHLQSSAVELQDIDKLLLGPCALGVLQFATFLGIPAGLYSLIQSPNKKKEKPFKVWLCALLDGDEEEIGERAAQAASKGYRCAKIKIRGLDVDAAARITLAVRKTMGPETILRVDVNREHSFEEAVAYARAALNPAGEMAEVQFVEEPLREIKQLRGWLRATGLSCALDETAREYMAKNPLHLFLSGDKKGNVIDMMLPANAASQTYDPMEDALKLTDYVVLRPTLGLGLQLPFDGPQVLSSAYESGVGMGALVYYETITRERLLQFAGLDTYSYLAEDVLRERLPLYQPWVDARQVSRMSQQVDESKLELIGDV